MYFYIETFGCQMNEHDSEKMASLLMESGMKLSPQLDCADIVVVNTCCVRQKAEQKFYSLMGRLRSIKKRRKIIVGVTGCIAQMEKDHLYERLPFIDFALGPSSIHNILHAIRNAMDYKPLFDFSDNGGGVPSIFLNPNKRAHRIKAYVSIMKGCNNFCSYCIVPYVRGREVSRDSKDIMQEIEAIARRGIKEVTLLGQNVNSYNKGRDDLPFPELLKTINSIEGIDRIRFVTSHPRDISDSLIDCFGTLEKLCEHIHLPFQSGSDKILSLMNRGYTSHGYREKVNLLRQVCPHIAITADCIVGFPGEDEDDFEATMRLIEDIQFDGLFSFAYSPRPYTKALNYDGAVPRGIALGRLATLQKLQRNITHAKNRAMEGYMVDVLVEGTSKHSPYDLTGRTRTNKIVNFAGPEDLVGKNVAVTIIKGYANSLRGEKVREKEVMHA